MATKRHRSSRGRRARSAEGRAGGSARRGSSGRRGGSARARGSSGRQAVGATHPGAQGRSRSSGKGRQSSPHSSAITTDHDEIRQWAEERGGKPACVKGTGGQQDTGMIRIEFPGAPRTKEKSLQEITWDE